MGNGKLGNDNPGSSANSTVIPLFIWNVDMQLLYIKLSAVIYATLLNCQLVAVFSVSAITQIRHYCIEPTFYQKPTPLFAVRRCFYDMKGRRPRCFNLSTGVFESIRRSTHIRMRLVCGSRSASFSCCEDNAVRKLLMLTAVQSDVTHSASASTLERQSTLERERLLKSHAFNTER